MVTPPYDAVGAHPVANRRQPADVELFLALCDRLPRRKLQVRVDAHGGDCGSLLPEDPVTGVRDPELEAREVCDHVVEVDRIRVPGWQQRNARSAGVAQNGQAPCLTAFVERIDAAVVGIEARRRIQLQAAHSQ